MKCILILFATCATAYSWSMSGYACNQPQLYQQCNCQSFCSGYMMPQPDPCDGGCGGGGYYPHPRRHRIRHHHKKPRRKFRLDSSDEDLHVPPPRKISSHRVRPTEGFVEEKAPVATTTISTKDSSWENEDLWEKKFVTEAKEEKLDEEEFPEITSEEVESARRISKPVATSPPVSSGGGGGQGIGVNTGLGIGGPGIGGLGGGGGLFGISSGVGVGVPGVGPIGISSGLGIG